MNTIEADWTFLSSHAHVLVCLAENPQAKLRDIADRVGVTERTVMPDPTDPNDPPPAAPMLIGHWPMDEETGSVAEDVVNGNLRLIIGMVWQLILKYQMSQSKVPPKKLMLSWINAVLPDMHITNFSCDWNDGVALTFPPTRVK